MKYINEIIKDEYKQWETGDLIFINAGTGRGKTHFIKNTLNTYCKENKKQILYLTNRDNLKLQVKNDIGKESNITVINYQKIEQFILKNITLDNFDYVICDECHYFFTDSAFNRKTDLFFNKIIKDKSICKIFMTATPRTILRYLNESNIKINFEYKLQTNYNYIDKVTCFKNYESINEIIKNIPEDEQIIFFSSAKRALEVSKKYNGTFICSKYNKDGLWNKYIAPKRVKNEKGEEELIPTENYLELQRIIETGEFKNHLLCTTTVLDNGINIKENTPVKHIIIDVLDRDTFIQCLGRKRICEGEKINLYFYGWSNKKVINGLRTKVNNSIDRVDFLRKHGELEYVKQKYKKDIFDNRIIDEVIGSDGQIHKVINECMYKKFHVDMAFYDALLLKKNSFKKVISKHLNINENQIINLEVIMDSRNLEEILNSIVGKKLFKEEQKELKETFEKFGLKARTLGINTLNGYLKDKKLPFIIENGRERSRKSKNYNKRYWIIGKIIY